MCIEPVVDLTSEGDKVLIDLFDSAEWMFLGGASLRMKLLKGVGLKWFKA